MTICKSILSSTTDSASAKLHSKIALKRSYDPALLNVVTPKAYNEVIQSYNDDSIQSTGSRRRYMRRGSRAPSMLVMICLSDLDPKHDDNDNDDSDAMMKIVYPSPRQARRFSLSTSLHRQLGGLSISDNKGKIDIDHVKLEHSQFMQIQRRFSYDPSILSHPSGVQCTV